MLQLSEGFSKRTTPQCCNCTQNHHGDDPNQPPPFKADSFLEESILLSWTRWWLWSSQPPPALLHCSYQAGAWCLSSHCQCSGYSLEVLGLYPQNTDSCVHLSSHHVSKYNEDSLRFFKQTVSGFSLHPQPLHHLSSNWLGGDINSHMYPSWDWFTCITYKVNAASGDPRGPSCCLFFPGNHIATTKTDKCNWWFLSCTNLLVQACCYIACCYWFHHTALLV